MGYYNKSRKETIKRAKKQYKQYKKNKRSKFIFLIPFVALLLIIGGIVCFVFEQQEAEVFEQEGDLKIEKTEETGEVNKGNNEINLEQSSEIEIREDDATVAEIEGQVDEYCDTLNLEAKIGQLFIIPPEELTGIGIAVQAGETTQQKMKEYPIGGFIFGDQNFEVLDQIQLMLNSIEVYSKTPIFLAMDDEGARRITNMNLTLSEVGFDLEYIEEELYLVNDNNLQKVSDDLNVVNLDNQNVIEVINEGAELVIVQDGFTNTFESVVDAVRNGEIEEDLIEEKVRAILTYKLENGI